MDLLDYIYVSEYWAEKWMIHMLLSPTVHFLSSFLVDEGDGDIFGNYAEEVMSGIN